MNIKKISTISVLVLSCIGYIAGADDDKSTTQNKNITIISGKSTADGKSKVHKELLEECIESLPGPKGLQAEVTSNSQYLKEINGDPSRNEFVKTYSASIEVFYMVYKKVLLIITTSSIQAQEPITKIIEKRIRHSKRFVSNPSQGDIFAGKSHRKHYFSSEDEAVKDVRKRAIAWLNQQNAVICTKK